ncbi:CRM-domain containing factor CFM3, chloroplastic/mitochondrial isoform X1 [Vigna radiata var. radiata]|uniref:CRM-domain containing factor CFM3, chloroplastic/mitochondrial isoform X1 n=2 Tax=Vigna radiata var. radiata TaxID=3916 RepID=A0A1S3UYV8_VIGRR|nr:CRM-domain containing factor CFM3, chloroplastic/mitochondrial isoform X1 [Vigna radiata var. radiata]
MAWRFLALRPLTKFHFHNNLSFNSSFPKTSLDYAVCKVRGQEPIFYQLYYMKTCSILGSISFHSCSFLKYNNKVAEKHHQDSEKAPSGNEGNGNAKENKKKLKGKRAVVRWLKFFRFKKKKEYERMTSEEKILYKLLKARKKEERLCEALKKIEPAESSETTHDPEILTPEEHFFFLKMGLKCKNYVPVGRRGIYQGVILNMHLHWKKHQTLKVVVKTFSVEEVKDIAVELARLSGGIVLDIHEDNTIIMYRGKNYSQPPTEIMSPRVSLSRKKALDKSKYRDALRAVRRYIPRLEQELEILQAQFKSAAESNTYASDAIQDIDRERISNFQLDNSDKHQELMDDNIGSTEDETDNDSELDSDSDKLSDIFETDSDVENFTKEEKPLYLDEFDKFPEQSNGETNDFEEHLRQMSLNSKHMEKDQDLPKLDEVDRIFLHATSFLKKKTK